MNGRSVLIEDAAMLMGVSRRTVYYWIRDGRLETVRTRGGSQRVLVQSIAKVLELNLRHRAGLPAVASAATANLAASPTDPGVVV